MEAKYKVGDKIYFAEEKRPYTIRACDKRFLICTKPFNLKPKTVIYTIVDLVEGIRGTDNYSIGWCDYYKTEDCKEMLKELQETYNKNDGELWLEGTFISHRNRINLNIVNKFDKQYCDMETPEKLYLHPTAKGEVGANWLTFQLTNEDVEYVRTDTFIDKACEWLKKSTILSDTTIERFKQAMEEQQ